MALTTEQRLQALESKIATLEALITAQQSAYVNKLQWQQLDTVRESDMTQVKKRIDILETKYNV